MMYVIAVATMQNSAHIIYKHYCSQNLQSEATNIAQQ